MPLVVMGVEGRPPETVLLGRRSTLRSVQEMLGLPQGPCEWETVDGCEIHHSSACCSGVPEAPNL